MLRSCVLCTVLWGWLHCLAWAEPPLRIAVETDYPPFAYMENGKLTGFDLEFSEALCRELQRVCQLMPLPLNEIIPALIDGRADIAVASLTKNAARMKLVNFTNRYYRSRTSFVGKNGTWFADTDKHAFRGLRLGTQKSSAQEALVRAMYTESTIKSFDTLTQTAHALYSGEVDVIILDMLCAVSWLKSQEGSGFDFVAAPLSVENPLNDAYIAVRKDEETLLHAINVAIPNLKYNGVYDQINRKYFPFSVY